MRFTLSVSHVRPDDIYGTKRRKSVARTENLPNDLVRVVFADNTDVVIHKNKTVTVQRLNIYSPEPPSYIAIRKPCDNPKILISYKPVYDDVWEVNITQDSETCTYRVYKCDDGFKVCTSDEIFGSLRLAVRFLATGQNAPMRVSQLAPIGDDFRAAYRSH